MGRILFIHLSVHSDQMDRQREKKEYPTAPSGTNAPKTNCLGIPDHSLKAEPVARPSF